MIQNELTSPTVCYNIWTVVLSTYLKQWRSVSIFSESIARFHRSGFASDRTRRRLVPQLGHARQASVVGALPAHFVQTGDAQRHRTTVRLHGRPLQRRRCPVKWRNQSRFRFFLLPPLPCFAVVTEVTSLWLPKYQSNRQPYQSTKNSIEAIAFTIET